MVSLKIQIWILSMRKIGMRLKKVREAYNLTSAVFSKTLGINQSNLSRIENGQTPPSAKAIIAAYEKFQIDPLWLLTGKGQNSEIENPTALKIGKTADKLPEEIRQSYLAAMERELLLHTILEEQRQETKKASSE